MSEGMKQAESEKKVKFPHLSKTIDHGKSADQQSVENLLYGRYEILSEIGRGAQGRVYLARHMVTGKRVAVKQMRIASIDNWKQYTLFRREGEVLSSLNVDGVARLYEIVEDLDGENPSSVIIQEYIEGKSLQAYLNEGRIFRFGDICDILIQLIDILDMLHHHNPPVIHRDIKPSNIILHYDNGRYALKPKVYLIDFGAVANPQVQDGGSTVTGTYGYMAPEQLVGKAETVSDIYSFAVLAVYLLSGTCPEDIEMQDLRLLIDRHLENYPHVVTVFLRKMLEQNPERRLCRYEIIRSILLKFSRQNFNIEMDMPDESGDTENAHAAPKGFKSVAFLGQKGNIELWENLSDSEHRKVPEVYKGMIRKYALCTALGIKSGELSDISRLPYADMLLKKVQRSMMGIILILTIVCIVLYFIPGIQLEISQTVYVRIFGVLILIDLIATSVLYENAARHAGRLLRHGRKTIALIDKITCMPASLSETFYRNYEDADIKCSSGESKQNLKKIAKKLNRRMAEKKVYWRVAYSFNPPDDKADCFLVHEYYSYDPVFLQKGDTLPILYEIRRDEQNRETVFSMPFPLPAHRSLMLCRGLLPQAARQENASVSIGFIEN